MSSVFQLTVGTHITWMCKLYSVSFTEHNYLHIIGCSTVHFQESVYCHACMVIACAHLRHLMNWEHIHLGTTLLKCSSFFRSFRREEAIPVPFWSNCSLLRESKTSIAMESASSSPAVQHSKSVEWKSVNEGISKAGLYTRLDNVTTVQVYALNT